ncbi:hypothetical protein M8R19_15595 [Pseudomonas sp. R3.Fl]|uniref:hypothetical protein n=1 Tax=Pseudomonas sp. R3.Fl TaxID=2928708 RepID=UPI00201DC7D9|nr:hypothetical protein [Pseudomonas sp. R3.Fl]MCL6690132.1 hypothetical protein [Pseudomonas sp. R3.Fl]
MTTTERLARFEAAQEVLGFLMAACAEWIYIESKKAQPDASKIAQWEAERTAFFDIEDGLRLDDQDSIEQVITTYGPVARRIFEAR